MNSGLASWVPVDVLVGALTLVLGYIFKRVTDDNRKQTETIETLSVKITKLADEMQQLRLQQTSFATVEQLGRFGDRFDNRMTNAMQDIAVLKATQERK